MIVELGSSSALGLAVVIVRSSWPLKCDVRARVGAAERMGVH